MKRKIDEAFEINGGRTVIMRNQDLKDADIQYFHQKETKKVKMLYICTY